jgi:hypothetical protein
VQGTYGATYKRYPPAPRECAHWECSLLWGFSWWGVVRGLIYVIIKYTSTLIYHFISRPPERANLRNHEQYEKMGYYSLDSCVDWAGKMLPNVKPCPKMLWVIVYLKTNNTMVLNDKKSTNSTRPLQGQHNSEGRTSFRVLIRLYSRWPFLILTDLMGQVSLLLHTRWDKYLSEPLLSGTLSITWLLLPSKISIFRVSPLDLQRLAYSDPRFPSFCLWELQSWFSSLSD